MKKMSPLALAFIASLFIILSQFILSDEWVSVIKNPLGLFRSALPDFEYAVVRVGGIVLTYSILFLFIYLGQKKTRWYKTKPEWVLMVVFITFVVLVNVLHWLITQ